MGLNKFFKLPEPSSPHVKYEKHTISPHTFAVVIKSDNPCQVSVQVNAYKYQQVVIVVIPKQDTQGDT